MRGRRTLGISALLIAVVLLGSGCEYFRMAQDAAKTGGPVPWFCNPTAPNSVTGPGMGTTNWYAGMTRSPLDHENCKRVAYQLDQAKAYAEQYPTAGDAEAVGFRSTFAFIAGMGTHHGLGTITPELLTDPDFDRFNPIIPDSIIDDVFDPAQPEFLQYNGNGPDAELIGMSYYVRTDTGLPPAGFEGGNDWWHHHPSLCLNPSNAQAVGVNNSESSCASKGGINVYLGDYYMLHVWLVDDIEYYADVHAPMHPCITGSGAIFDMDHPCHDSAGVAGASAGGEAPLGRATAGPAPGFCPIAQLNDQ